ncbi:MAG: recombinase family protein [Verrucomicrobiales bacterium]|nr:recombinase family protein [Planctomycetota bacterium]MCP5524370.1 recombinase family protein [Verrucomicrobiales bacterium]
MKTKAFSYLRTSGKGQVGNDGFPRQRETIRRYCKANRLEIVEEFSDEAVSGTTDGLDRAGLTDLFVALRANGVRTVVVENATRLARDLMVSEIILAEFRKEGVKVFSADGGIDLTLGNDDPTGKLIRQILGAVAEWEKCALVQKLRASRVRIRRAGGRCEGRKPYGQTEAEQQTLGTIRSLRREGKSYAKIAAQLNHAGIPARDGGKWHPTQITRILSRTAAKPQT